MVDVAQYSNEVKRDSEHLIVIQKVKVCVSQYTFNFIRVYMFGCFIRFSNLKLKINF